jgi:SAM-dependent methyltransferase
LARPAHNVGVIPEGSGPGIVHRPAAFARLFNEIPDDYEARPAYPAWVFETLADRCGLGAGSRVLEIGAGSGQATLPLLDRGAQITAVEPGAGLARRLRERTQDRDVEIVVARFEDAVIPDDAFDVAVSATAFHWVDTAAGLAKCGAALKDGGWLALWWTIWGDPERADTFHDALQPVLRQKAPHLLEQGKSPTAYISDIAARTSEIERTGAFGPVGHDVLHWEHSQDPVGLRRLFATFAPWLALTDELRTELLDDVERLARDEFGGIVVRPYQTVLYTAERLRR